MTMNIKEAFRIPNRVDQKMNSSQHIIVKVPSAQNKERILKAVREKGHVTYKDRPIRTTPDFSTETNESQKILDRHHADPKRTQVSAQAAIPAKLLITIDGERKIFQDKTKFTQYLTTNPALQRMIDRKSNTRREITPQEKQGNN